MRVLTLIFCLLVFGLSAQRLTAPKIINFEPKVYDAHAQSFAITQDKRGLIYVANLDGLLEYDGASWRKIQPKSHAPVFSIAIDENDNMFVGGLNEIGFLRVENTAYTYESLVHHLPDSLKEFGYVLQTIVQNDKIYYNGSAYIYQWDGTTVTPIQSPAEDIKIIKVGKEIWCSSRTGGLYKLEDQQFKLMPHAGFFEEKNIVGIEAFLKNKWLISTRQGGVYIYDTDEDHMVVPFAERYFPLLERATPYGMIKLSNGNFLINTLNNGLFEFNSTQELKNHIKRSHGLQNEKIAGVFEDEHNQIWCATFNGISLIDLSSDISFAYEGDQYFGPIQDIDRLGSELFLATVGGLFVADLSDSIPSFKQIEEITSECFDLNPFGNSMLICSNVIHQYVNNKLVKVSDMRARTAHHLSNNPNRIIAGGVGGVGIYEHNVNNNTWSEVLRYKDFPTEIYDIDQISNSHEFWAVTLTHGLYKLRFNEDFSKMTYKHIEDTAFNSSGQISMINYGGKTLFSHNQKLFQYDPSSGKFEQSNYLKALGGRNLYKFRTRDDHIWMTNGSWASHFFDNYLDTITFRNLDIGDVPAIFPDKHGSCWLGGTNALVYYENTENNKAEQFHCNIRRIIQGDSTIFNGMFTNGDAWSFNQTEVPSFNFKFNSLEFYFSSTWYIDDNIDYSYQLEGYDPAFSKWSSEIKKEYTNLPSGSYEFKVKAKNKHGEESTVATYKFVILPPWYQTWWAYTIFVIIGVLLIGLVVFWYSRKLRREKITLEKIVQERTAELDIKNRRLEENNNEIRVQKALVDEKNKDITDSILYAQKIQSAILTSKTYLDKIFTDHFLIYRPKDILSGDFYWAYHLQKDGQDKLIWLAADCTGHGVPGSLMSMLGHSFINESVIENGESDPGKILEFLREHIINTLSSDNAAITRDGMDIAICVYDKTTQELTYSGAKNPLWIVRGEGEPADNYHRKIMGDQHVLYEWRGDSQPVGYSEVQKPFNVTTIRLEKNDLILTFTDGFADQFGGKKNKKMQQKNFKNQLLKHADKSPLEIGEALEDFFINWMGNETQIDDVCVFGVRV